MYNGIGLETARGSGTNGFVQRNMAFVRPRKDKISYKTEAEIAKSEALLNREPNLEILEHERKRKIELKCVELQELMEEQSYDQDTIDQKVDAFRQKLIEKDKSEKPQITLDESGRPIVTGTHQIAAASLDRNKKLRDAFGISSDYVDGSSMDPARKQKEMDARAVTRQKMEQKRALIKDPEDDLPPVKSSNLKRDQRKESLPDVVSAVKSRKDESRKEKHQSKKSSRESPPEEGELSQDDRRKHGTREKRQDKRASRHSPGDKKRGEDRPSQSDTGKKRGRSLSTTSSSDSGSESDTEGSDSDRESRKRVDVRHKRQASPAVREKNHGSERRRKSDSPLRKRVRSPEQKQTAMDRRQDVDGRNNIPLSRDRTKGFSSSGKYDRSPERRRRSATPTKRPRSSREQNSRQKSPLRTYRGPSSPDRKRPASSQRNHKERSTSSSDSDSSRNDSPKRLGKSPSPRRRNDARKGGRRS